MLPVGLLSCRRKRESGAAGLEESAEDIQSRADQLVAMLPVKDNEQEMQPGAGE